MSNWKKGLKLNNGQYVIESILLRSGTGFYYRAKDTTNSQLVTIKAIDIFWASREDKTDFEQKLIKQAQMVASKCSNPYIVKLYPQVFLEDNRAYMVMDYLDGVDLATYLDRNGKFSPDSALKLVTKIATALNVIHQNKCIHQDIKPQNIIFDEVTEDPILTDYGLAVKLFALAPRKPQNMDCFSPPESSNNNNIKPATDIYSLTAILYVLVTGQLPTPANFRTYKDLIPPQQFTPELSDRFNQGIIKGMELDIEKRPQNLRDWFQLFKESTNNNPPNTVQKTPISTAESRQKILDAVVDNDETIVQKVSPINAPPTIIKPKTNYPNIETFEFETISIETEKKLFGLMSSVKKNPITKSGQFFVEYLGEGVNLDMVFIPAGSFMMGSNNNEDGRDKDESPLHLVNLNSFYISKYPITQLQWRTVSSFPKATRPVKTNPSAFKGDNLPVEKVSWLDAQEFCKRLSKYTNRTYRLPTESEWEYACRGNTKSAFFFGDSIVPDIANYDSRNDHKKGKYDKKTSPVDSFYPNPFGLYDVHGNVWEWCEDHYANNYIHKPKDGSAYHAPMSNQPRVVRGGSWSLSSQYCRSAKRSSYAADSNYNFVGFRVVCVIDND
ncbi:bifunctional serine/threonine-protein kinase/formylglycine-generating enzyme family protein [Geminocystis sp. CENA526]|uniref:bifunctional serine/threonine-protein kinase/formylglycine-generating enzyme family protein n=1 Tax=Geminocystis sp. CENA526 TaxID=1355871 RepID=UPI003D6F677E